MPQLLIATGNLKPGCLENRTAIVTGAGRGIGFEAARGLLWLGARVTIAEIDVEASAVAEDALRREWGPERVLSVPTDVSDEGAVTRLMAAVVARFGSVDIVVNNATAAPTGSAVWETPIEDWDRSYAVNLRAPVLLARACLPEMRRRGHGVFVCVSSVGGPYQGAYESLKAAQVSLANALDAELAGSGVTAFTIGPGLVPTDTAVAAVARLLPRLGLSAEQFRQMTAPTLLSVEAAGAGFAAAVALADRYAGQEVSSTQALIDAGVELPSEPESFPFASAAEPSVGLGAPLADAAASACEAEETIAGETSRDRAPAGSVDGALALCHQVRVTLAEQSADWRRRSFFERQWMLRDFKQRVGMPVEGCLAALEQLEESLSQSDGAKPGATRSAAPLGRLSAYYDHLADLARGYVKDAAARDEQLEIVSGWRAEVDRLTAALAEPAGSAAR